MQNDSKFLKDYLETFNRLATPTDELISRLSLVKDRIVQTGARHGKTIVVGNGGSAAIASHFSVDLTKNAGVRSINFNESSLITCFANDYGYERWMEKAVEFYGNEGDLLIAISSSGCSKNILLACQAARVKKFSSVVTFSGFAPDNPLRKLGDINLWVDSRAYNRVETLHQLWLLALVDLIIGKAEYSANPELENSNV
ncbi:MAG: SIS domain-containing protein [Chlamydiae bacterium]|nr:SIS domain-containing protein [Chlamydiota bacterium]MBI3267043.1 SIS domain-containing protein [Chlamydiota bacterium]